MINQKTVMVTGGAGFIGSNFVRWLLNNVPYVNIITVDLLTYAGNLENLFGLASNRRNRHEFCHGNICNQSVMSHILESKNISLIVNFAAETHVDRSLYDPELFFETNTNGVLSLLEAVRKNNRGKDVHFHQISTDEVYGSLWADEPAFTEKTPYAPNSPYSASKAAADHLVRAYWKTYRVNTTISNCSNNYGGYQYPEKLIPVIILNAIGGKPLPVYGDGQQIRDWVFVEDHCEAIWRVANHGSYSESYNIGGNNQPTNLEIVEQICEILDTMKPDFHIGKHRNLIEFVKDRPGHDRRYAMDTSKIERELGWRPKETLETGLLKTVNWYLNNMKWVNNVRAKPDYQDWMNKNYKNRGLK